MSKLESDVEEAGVTVMRSPSPTLARPFSTSLTSPVVASLSVDSDTSRRDVLMTIVSAFGEALSTADSSLAAPSSGRRSKNVMQRVELSRRVRDMEEQVEQLRRRQPSHGPSSSQSPLLSMPSQQDDSELRRQIETLQVEVERLKAGGKMDEAPPAYEVSENRS